MPKTTPQGHAITKKTRIKVGAPISGMYNRGGGSCVAQGVITEVAVNETYTSRRYRISVKFHEGHTASYSTVRPSGESDYTDPVGTCDHCGEQDSMTWLQYRHEC